MNEHYMLMSVETDSYCVISYSAYVDGWAVDAPSNSYSVITYPANMLPYPEDEKGEVFVVEPKKQ